MRGEEISVAVARFLRGLGHDSAATDQPRQRCTHIPLICWRAWVNSVASANWVLNPFMGPRFKSVVITTNMPLAVDKPIDFGLQYFCGHCLKCARECPATPYPLATRSCSTATKWEARRRALYPLPGDQSSGSACGRCMKTCPLNKVVDLDGPITEQIASWLGVHAMWAKPCWYPSR